MEADLQVDGEASDTTFQPLLSPARSTILSRPRPQSQEQWRSFTCTALDEVGNLTRDLLKQMDAHSAVESANPLALSRKVKLNQNRSMQVRLGLGTPARSCVNIGPKNARNHRMNLDVCSDALQSFVSRTVQLRDALLRLEHAQRGKWSALKVCEWRMELRSKRPEPEMFKDIVQEALEKEQQALAESREALGVLATELKQVLTDYEVCRARLSKHNYGLSRDGLLSPLPALISSPKAGEEAETQEQVLKKAEALFQKAVSLDTKAEATLKTADARCLEANSQVMSGFTKRATHTAALKRNAEEKLQLACAAIESAEKQVFRTKSFSKIHATPGVRSDGQEETVALKSVETTEAKLALLREAKVALEEELRCKLASIKIDEQCRKLPPHMTPAHPKPAARDFHRLLMSMSSPDLAAGMSGDLSPSGIVRQRSALGSSSPLKAAAAASTS